MVNDQYELFLAHFSQAQSIIVIVNPHSRLDTVAASAAFFLACREFGKQVQFVTQSIRSVHDRLDLQPVVGLEFLQNDLGNRNLQVSFDYTPEKVDKVNYHIDESSQKFYLTIEPQTGHAPLDPTAIEYDLVGTDADLIVLFGVQDYENLEQLYFGYEAVYEGSTVISINSFASAVGDVKLDYGQKAAVCEGVLELLLQAQLPVSSDVATNILLGIDAATQTFSSLTTSADTFEAVATVLRQGARRIKRSSVEQSEAASQLTKGQTVVMTPAQPAKPVETAMPTQPAQPTNLGQVDTSVQQVNGNLAAALAKKSPEPTGVSANASIKSNKTSGKKSPPPTAPAAANEVGSLNYQPGSSSSVK